MVTARVVTIQTDILKHFCTSNLTLTSFLYLVQLTFMGHSLGFILVFIFLLVSLLTAGHFYVSGFIDWLSDLSIHFTSSPITVSFSQSMVLSVEDRALEPCPALTNGSYLTTLVRLNQHSTVLHSGQSSMEQFNNQHGPLCSTVASPVWSNSIINMDHCAAQWPVHYGAIQ